MQKRLLAYINAENGIKDNLIETAALYENLGMDGLFVYNHSENETEREEFLLLVKDMARVVDIPIIIGCRVGRFEDVKKAFYTGAVAVSILLGDIKDTALLKESIDRFGAANIYVEADMTEGSNAPVLEALRSGKLSPSCNMIAKHTSSDDGMKDLIALCAGDLIIRDSLVRNDIGALMAIDKVSAVATNFYENTLRIDEDGADRHGNIMKVKRALEKDGIEINTFKSALSFDDLKTFDGLIPCVTQDYRTGQVLMVAYMDKEAFEKTVETGIMTYHSRSRNELWVKGLTSGHFQYVKEISADCDKDTLLAKVRQIGAACHTGSYSCFFNTMVRHDFDEKNPYAVLKKLYDVVIDRKKNPKEGSYTNYLFDKGIDKILKKCGEEATEMVIAAKNPGAEELKYEIADLMYHMTVLMVECGIDWDDVMGELANR
ncbi:MAG: bifunctional phosphoribosyl-AMP cyclohydrolase/phosphoribosyl-ATP diphosphatase HisIE [Lachnospiraceae bacterium]|nr:bifunctional phosphoribosyl-AMP cyclohydrolase/phosphoribosyl-ATP diphosphatase HisIE [Lachnospiraceae bacterium]